jgi:hypothetical protein
MFTDPKAKVAVGVLLLTLLRLSASLLPPAPIGQGSAFGDQLEGGWRCGADWPADGSLRKVREVEARLDQCPELSFQ